MTDNQFDKFVNDKLSDYAAPIPAGLWEKVAEGQFDQFVGQQLREATAPVPDGLFDKILDTRFDRFVANTLQDAEAPVPDGLWDRIQDGQFDSFVGDAVQEYEAPVPEGLWDKIKPTEEEDRPVAWLWFRYPAAAIFILAALLGGAAGTYYFLQHQQSRRSVPASASTVANQSKLAVPATPSLAPEAGGKQTPGEAAASPANTVKNPDKLPATVPVTANEQTSPGSNASSNRYPVTASGNSSGSITLKPAASEHLPKYQPSHTGTHPEPLSLANTGDGSSSDLADLSYPDQVFLPGHTLSLTSAHKGYSMDLVDIAGPNPHHASSLNNVIICPTDRKYHNTDWYLETYVSPELSFKSVSNVSATPQYLARKDSSESQRIGFTAGVRLVKPLTDNILLKTGLQYSQINQKYVYRTENEVKTTTVVTVRTIIRAPGDTVIVKDTSVLQTIGYRNNVVANHFKSFDIPLTIGYQFGNEDLTFGINAGVLFNISSWYQGVILDTSLATVNLNKTGNMQYKTKLGLGLYGGISVVKSLGDDLSLFFEPYFRYNLSNMTTDQAPYRQKFTLGGLSIGLRWNLNRQ
ncbi:MAG TPA: hypothetical protein VG842_07860 [Sediminibacterium sp.]|nr:hypothetical protein [Sediminibacterium sp.]